MRAALTQTVNAYRPMPRAVAGLAALAGRLDALRESNLARNAELVAAAARAGAKAICLGELFSAPYFALGKEPLWRALAEDAREGPSVRAMRRAARAARIVVVAPIYELDRRSGRRFNAAVVIERDGRVLGRYRKVHIPDGANEQGEFHERFYYEPSDGAGGYFPVFKTSAGRLGIAICYDRHFEGVMAALARNGAQLVFSPAVTFGAKSRRMWELEFRVDAARQRLFIGGSNRRGRERPWGQRYFGASYFAGPDGERLPDLSTRPDLVISELDLAALERPDPSGWNLRRDARPEAYRRQTRR